MSTNGHTHRDGTPRAPTLVFSTNHDTLRALVALSQASRTRGGRTRYRTRHGHAGGRIETFAVRVGGGRGLAPACDRRSEGGRGEGEGGKEEGGGGDLHLCLVVPVGARRVMCRMEGYMWQDRAAMQE